MFDGTLVKLIKFPAEHLTIFHGTLVFRGTPVENHCSIEYHDSHTNAGCVALFVKDSLAYRIEIKFMVDTPGSENLWLQFDTIRSNTFCDWCCA